MPERLELRKGASSATWARTALPLLEVGLTVAAIDRVSATRGGSPQVDGH